MGAYRLSKAESERARLIEQRDALLAALKIMTLNPQHHAYLTGNDPMALRQIERAIAKTEGVVK